MDKKELETSIDTLIDLMAKLQTMELQLRSLRKRIEPVSVQLFDAWKNL